MKIVHTIESYVPAHFGMPEVLRHLSEGLVQLGHEVVILTSFHPDREINSKINGVNIISFGLSGNAVEGINGDSKSYTDFLLHENFDVLTNFGSHNWASDLCFPILSRIKANLFFVSNGFPELTNPLYKKYFEDIPRWLRQYKLNIFLSTNCQDYKFAIENNIENRIIIPNGVSTSEVEQVNSSFDLRRCLNIHYQDRIILHMGSYNGIKGHGEPIDIFLDTKSLNTHLVYLGQNFSFSSRKFYRMRFNLLKEIFHYNVIKYFTYKVLVKYLKLIFLNKKYRIHGISLTQQELICALKQSDIFLFPKLLECSTDILYETKESTLKILACQQGNIPVIIHTPNAGQYAAELIDLLLDDAILIKKFCDSEDDYWKNNFTWEKFVLKYQSLYLNQTI